MKKLTPDPKYIGGDMPGFFGALHTWGRQWQYHPHIHYIAPGGALLRKDGSWHSSRTDFYLPVKAMSKIFRKKFYHEMEKEGLLSGIPANVWTTDWNINSQAIGSSSNSIKYLAPYFFFKVAISDKRIVKVDGRIVFIRYRKKGSGRWRTMKLDVMEFIRRFLQHVLPTGFMKVRYYGFLNPSSSVTLEYIRQLIGNGNDYKLKETETEPRAKPALFCSHCEGKLKYCYSILPYQMIPPDTG